MENARKMDIQFFGLTTKPMSWKNTLNRIIARIVQYVNTQHVVVIMNSYQYSGNLITLCWGIRVIGHTNKEQQRIARPA